MCVHLWACVCTYVSFRCDPPRTLHNQSRSCSHFAFLTHALQPSIDPFRQRRTFSPFACVEEALHIIAESTPVCPRSPGEFVAPPEVVDVSEGAVYIAYYSGVEGVELLENTQEELEAIVVVFLASAIGAALAQIPSIEVAR